MLYGFESLSLFGGFMIKITTRSTVIASITLLILSFLLPCIASAKDIKMYDQPKNDAKVVGTVDLAKGIIPIFTPKDNTWMKIADPRNGDVGWVKSADIKDATGGSMSFSYYQSSEKPDAATQAEIDKLQAKQKMIQQNMQNNLKEMMNDLQSLYQNQMKLLEGATTKAPTATKK